MKPTSRAKSLVPAERLVNGVVPEGPVPRSLTSILKNFKYLYGVWLQSLSKNTRRAYQADLQRFADWKGLPDEKRVAEALSQLHGSEANMLFLEWQNTLVARELSPASVNRTIAALKSFVKLLRMNGLVSWTIEIPKRKTKAYKDTKGCGTDIVEEVINRLSQDNSPAGARDEAITRILWGCGLRRGEISKLDLKHVDLKAKTLSILGKGRHETERLDLTDKIVASLRRWIGHRGTKPGALFLTFSRADSGQRLTDQGVWRLVRRHGLGRVHGIRHASITQALENSKGDVRAAMRFSRHKDLNTLMIYDDNRKDSARKISEGLEGNI